MYKRPLVLDNGVISEFNDVDILLGSTILESLQNDGNLVVRLQPVAKLSTGKFTLASDQSINTCKVYGLVFDENIGVGTFGNIVTHGVVDFPENVWMSNLNITLVPGQHYYLHGSGLSTVPDMAAAAAVKVGMALTNTRFKLDFENPIIL